MGRVKRKQGTTVVKETTAVAKVGAKNCHSADAPVEKLLKHLDSSPGWRVKNKFEAPASFFIPFEDGSGWNTMAGVDGG